MSRTSSTRPNSAAAADAVPFAVALVVSFLGVVPAVWSTARLSGKTLGVTGGFPVVPFTSWSIVGPEEVSMTRWFLPILAVVTLVLPAKAQTSPAAERAGSWFTNILSGEPEGRSERLQRYTKRLGSFEKVDFDLWDETATKAIGSGDYRVGLVSALTQFNPLWDKADQLVPGAVAKYAKRLEQIPAASVKEWQLLTNDSATKGALLLAAMTLAAENELFREEQFSDKAFQAFKAKYK
ncbi:MAG TPA: hypothetical protein VNA69_02400 [Thermoanaerobaculia bacterium]|nr:hypothetical protein [Thermoanaerobaculia bacterium]